MRSPLLIFFLAALNVVRIKKNLNVCNGFFLIGTCALKEEETFIYSCIIARVIR